MKKLVYIVNNRIPAERANSIQTMHMCVEFSKICNKKGWNFELVAPRRKNPLGYDPCAYHGFAEKIKIQWLWCFDAIGKFPGLGVVAYWLHSISYVISLIFWFLRDTDEIVVFTREIFIALLFRKHILELHTIPDKPSSLYRWAIQRCVNIVAITEGMKQDLVTMGCSESSIMVAPDGIDLKRFGDEMDQVMVRSELQIPSDAFVVVYTGSFFQHSWKGVDVLLEAAKKLSVHKNILVILVGGHAEELSEMGEYKNFENIRLVGHSPFATVRKYLAAADVLVLPNKSGSITSERYTSPLKLFEYMAVRRVIIASDLPSIREILDDESAFFVEPSSSEKLANIILHVSNMDKKDFKSKIDSAYKKAKEYAVDIRAERIFKIAQNIE